MKSKNIFSILVNIFSAIYPVLFFILLIILKVPVRLFSLIVITLALIEFIIRFSKRKNEKKFDFNILNPVFLLIIGILCLIINTSVIFKFYPMLINIMLLYTFGITLFSPPVMIYRFAVLADNTIPNSLGEKKIASYCYKVTVLWCVFFIINGSIAAWTAITRIENADFIWFLYNGPVAGFIIGTIFVCEYIVRKIVQRKISKSAD